LPYNYYAHQPQVPSLYESLSALATLLALWAGLSHIQSMFLSGSMQSCSTQNPLISLVSKF